MPKDYDQELKGLDIELEKEHKRIAVLESLKEYNKPDRVVPVLELAQELKELRANTKVSPTPFSPLTKILGGFHPGQLVVVSGPTGQGKTTILKTFTKTFIKEQIASLWFSYEVPTLEFLENFPGVPTFFVPHEMTTGKVQWIEQRILEAIAKYDAKIVFIDHLHYLMDMKYLANQNTSLL